MRYLLSLFMLLPGAMLFSQNKSTITVLLFPVASKPAMSVIADSVRFFRLPEDSLVLTPDLRYWRVLPTPLNIYPGDYRIAYRNMFGQTVNKTYRLYRDSIRIDLYPDSLTSYPDNTLARLQDKDSLVISFHSAGCFNDNTEKLVIRRKGQQLETLYYKDNWFAVGKKLRHKINILSGKRTLTPADISDFARFENELHHTQEHHCTTTDYYAIKSKYLNLDKTVTDCSWGGFRALTAAWFGNEGSEQH